MAHTLRGIHALPTVRLADRDTLFSLRTFLQRNRFTVSAIGGILVLLVAWRRSGLRGFGWAVGVCVLCTVAALLINGFPRPTRQPVSELRHGSAKVKSIDFIDRLFEGSRTRGLEAAQPVEVVGFEFAPEDHTETVVAADLIDGVSGLKPGSTVSIEYERNSPRTARILEATRTFPARNFSGIGLDIGIWVMVLGGFGILAHYIGQAWNRLVLRK
jgi:hypothetical protein